MTAGSNEKIQRPPYGGPPMVRINGSLVRKMREEQGLTQLYIATAVGVTTDTISRWENKKYPSVKKENALKLADALGVELESLLDETDSQEGSREKAEVKAPAEDAGVLPSEESREVSEQLHAAGRKRWPFFLLAFVFLITAAGGFYWYSRLNPNMADITVRAVRLLPPHAPAGSTFPVIVSVSSSYPERLSLIVTEYLPKTAVIKKSVPPWSASSVDRKKIKWIATSSSNSKFGICYLMQVSSTVEQGSMLSFRGEVTSSLTGRKIFQVNGQSSLKVQPYHWADINSDGQIDDEEILRVFDELGERKGLEFGLDEIKKIWSSGGYVWDSRNKRYIPVKQESDNEN